MPNPWLTRRRRRRKKLEAPLAAGELAAALLTKMGGSPERASLSGLWRNWDKALGPDLACVAIPMGGKDKILLLGAENAMQMQELRFMGAEIVERVNVWLGRTHFEEVRVSLFGYGKKRGEDFAASTLTRHTPDSDYNLKVESPLVFHVAATGSRLSEMDMESPVARCYARFARRGRQ